MTIANPRSGMGWSLAVAVEALLEVTSGVGIRAS
jgi:hypothetical protein